MTLAADETKQWKMDRYATLLMRWLRHEWKGKNR